MRSPNFRDDARGPFFLLDGHSRSRVQRREGRERRTRLHSVNLDCAGHCRGPERGMEGEEGNVQRDSGVGAGTSMT